MLKRIISIAVSAAVIMTAMVFPVTAADEVKKPEKNIHIYRVRFVKEIFGLMRN